MKAVASLRANPIGRTFDSMYRRHADDVYRYALAMLDRPADAEDATQTTFLNAYRALERGEHPRNARPWLHAIALNVCREHYRRVSRRADEVSLDDDPGELVLDPSTPAIGDVIRALACLPFNQRAALVMREFEGRSLTEIAAALDVSDSAVEALLFRGRRALREQLEGSLTCAEAEHAISRQRDGALPRAERGPLRAHLRQCPGCASLARRLRAQRSALRSLALVPVPASLRLSTLLSGGSVGAAAPAGVSGGGSVLAPLAGSVVAKISAATIIGAAAVGAGYVTLHHKAPSAPAARPAASVARHHAAVATPQAAAATHQAAAIAPAITTARHVAASPGRPVHSRAVHSRSVHSRSAHSRSVHSRPVHSHAVPSSPVPSSPVHSTSVGATNATAGAVQPRLTTNSAGASRGQQRQVARGRDTGHGHTGQATAGLAPRAHGRSGSPAPGRGHSASHASGKPRSAASNATGKPRSAASNATGKPSPAASNATGKPSPAAAHVPGKPSSVAAPHHPAKVRPVHSSKPAVAGPKSAPGAQASAVGPASPPGSGNDNHPEGNNGNSANAAVLAAGGNSTGKGKSGHSTGKGKSGH